MAQKLRVKLCTVLIVSLLFCACRTIPSEPKDPSPKAGISAIAENNKADTPFIDEINKIEREMTLAKQNQIDVLSPTLFRKAENACLKAKNKAGKRNDMAVVLEYTDTARKYLRDAEKNAEVARKILAPVIESRNKARIAGATQLGKDYQAAEDRFLILTQAIEKNNIPYAQKNAPAVNNIFRELELRAIKTEMIGAVRSILKQAEKENITWYAPESFAQAKKLLDQTDAFISENRYAKEQMYQMAQEDLFMAHRALSIAHHCKAIETMTPEEIAFYIEDTLHLITTQLGAPDMRDQRFYIQVDNIKSSIQSLLDDNKFMDEKLKLKQAELEAAQSDCEARIKPLNQKIAFLEGKTREEQAANERLLAQKKMMEQKIAAERRFHRLFVEVQNDFDASEAEVYKKGSQLVIRLKGIQFPVGQAMIMPKNYLLLSKVQRAIRTFGNPSVVIEGHTDSTGTQERNKYLSQQRAHAVRQYLVANQTLAPEKLIAVGYGAERPLASNATAKGRAINRRIDIIITPETQNEKQIQILQ